MWSDRETDRSSCRILLYQVNVAGRPSMGRRLGTSGADDLVPIRSPSYLDGFV